MSHLRRPIPKAGASDFLGRFREIISDPLNLLIERDARSGVVEDDLVYLHNGNRVAVRGPLAYYDGFSDILIINRVLVPQRVTAILVKEELGF